MDRMSPANAAAKRDARKMSLKSCRNDSYTAGIGFDVRCRRVRSGIPFGVLDGLRCGADCAPMAGRPERSCIRFRRWPIASRKELQSRRHAETGTSRVGTSRSTHSTPGTPAGRWIDRADKQFAKRARDVRGPSNPASHTARRELAEPWSGAPRVPPTAQHACRK